MKQPLKLAIAFLVLYVLAVCTPYGQIVENALTRGYVTEAWVFRIQYSIGPPPLRGEEVTLVLGTAVIVLIAVLRRQWLLAVAGAFVPGATAVSTYVLNRFVLPRPDISGAAEGLTEGSFPSGHVAVTAGIAIGAVLVCTPRVRPYVVAVGVTWLAFVAAAVQNLGGTVPVTRSARRCWPGSGTRSLVHLLSKATDGDVSERVLGPAPVLRAWVRRRARSWGRSSAPAGPTSCSKRSSTAWWGCCARASCGPQRPKNREASEEGCAIASASSDACGFFGRCASRSSRSRWCSPSSPRSGSATGASTRRCTSTAPGRSRR